MMLIAGEARWENEGVGSRLAGAVAASDNPVAQGRGAELLIDCEEDRASRRS